MSDDRAASPPVVVGASLVVEPGDATAPTLECDTSPPTPELDFTPRAKPETSPRVKPETSPRVKPETSPRVKPETSPPAQLGNTTAP
ncbi:MAG: hypothetical protein VB093_20695, partial [Propionicimonas sp.]|nr:hypothetical protein [Propionicimonas sp.]